MGSVSTHRGTSSMSATLHHHVCCCSVQSHAASGAGASAADATASASAAPLCLWGTHKIASGPCRSCKRPRQETSRERQRGQRSSPLLTPCSSTSRPPRRGRSAAGSAACIALWGTQKPTTPGIRAGHPGCGWNVMIRGTSERLAGAPTGRVTVKLAYDARDGGVGLPEVYLLKPASISAVRDVRSHGAACCGLLGLRCMHLCRERGA